MTALLGAENAERARLASLLESIRTTLVGGAQTGSALGALASGIAAAPFSAAAPAVNTDGGADAAPLKDAAPAASRTLKLVAQPEPDANPHLVEYARELLGRLEASYWKDVETQQPPSAVVQRLVEQLKATRELFVLRCETDGEPATADEFDAQLSTVLDVKGATSFGRHLGIAWYEVSQPAAAAGTRAVAS